MSDVMNEGRKAYESELASIDRDMLDAITAWLREDDGRIECFYEMLCAKLIIHRSKTADGWFYHNTGKLETMHKALDVLSPFGWHEWDMYLWAATHPEHKLYKRIPLRRFERVACAEHAAEFLG